MKYVAEKIGNNVQKEIKKIVKKNINYGAEKI